MMNKTGYNCFLMDPGVILEMTCKVCGSVCDVKRGVNGPTSWGGAMSQINHLHDFFYCPHNKEDWHRQALELKLKIEECPSPSIAIIMNKDLEKIIRNNSEKKEEELDSSFSPKKFIKEKYQELKNDDFTMETTIEHFDGSKFFLTNSLCIEDATYLFIFTEHTGAHYFHKEDIKIYHIEK